MLLNDASELSVWKKAAFRSGDKEEMKKVQRELREKITEGKESYRRKLERRLQ